jgi:hypothetical protein
MLAPALTSKVKPKKQELSLAPALTTMQTLLKLNYLEKIPGHNKIFQRKTKKQKDSLVHTVHCLLKLHHGGLVPLQNHAFHPRMILHFVREFRTHH